MDILRSEIIKYLSKNLSIKIFLMAVNLVIYGFCLHQLGETFALAHVSTVLFMSVYKAGSSFHAINRGQGANEYALSNHWERVLLATAWVCFIAASTKSYLFLISLIGLPISKLWLRAFDQHISGNLNGTYVLSSLPLVTSLAVAILLTVGLSDAKILVNGTMHSMILAVIGFVFWALGSKRMNICSELLHASISALLISVIVSMQLGEKAAMYLLFFKIAESFSQLITFVLSGLRNQKQLQLSFNNNMIIATVMFLSLAILIILFLVDHFIVIIIGLWAIFYAISTYIFVRLNQKLANYYIVISFLLVYTGVNFYVDFFAYVIPLQFLVWCVLSKTNLVSHSKGG